MRILKLSMLLLIVIILFTIVFIVYNSYNLKFKLKSFKSNNKLDDQKRISPTHVRLKLFNENKIRLCEKWIIITTINQPTDHVKYINDASYGWCVLVVGDKKTPSNWNYKDVFYLDVQSQINLLSKRYKIIDMIPFNSYLRKMAGYLYAIDNKAKYIYETDDDNSPLDGLFGFRYENFNGLESNCDGNNLFINPYNYFGQTSAWPRFILII